MPNKKISKINDEFDFLLLLKIIKSYWYVIVIGMSFFLFASWLYLRYTQKVYEATAIIQIEDNNSNSQFLEQDKIMSSNTNELAKKIDFLRSSSFLNIALSKLPLQVAYFYNGTILSTEMYKSSPFQVEIIKTDSNFISNSGEVKFLDKDNVVLKYEINGKSSSVSSKAIDGAFFINTNKFSLKLTITDFEEIRYKEKYSILFYNKQALAGVYLPKLSINVLNDAAKTIKINIKENNPQKAADIVNSIASEFREYDKLKKQESANNIIDYIDQQLLFIEDSLYSSEDKIVNYKQQHGIESVELKPLLTLQQKVGEIENSILKLSYDERLLSEIMKSVTNEKNIDIYQFLAQLIGSDYQGSLSVFLTQIQSLLMQKEQLMYDYTSNSGQIKQLNYQIEIQKKILVEAIRNFKSNINIKRAQFKTQLTELTNEILTKEDNTKTIELKKLIRVSNINETFYNQLIEAKAKYSILKAGFTSQNIILEQSKANTEPTSPKKAQTYLIAILMGFLISFGFIAVKYLFYNEISSIADISKYTDVPVLGMVPLYSSAMAYSQLIVDKEPKSQLAEAMRAIRTNLQFIDNSEGSKIISITSTISGEGKTFVAINLAGIIAYSGKKVIVLDLDMRKPKMHKAFSEEGNIIANKLGMSEILSNIEPYQNCIHKSRVEKIDFITAGTIPPNPSELILSESMDVLIRDLQKIYDFIIIDNPPIGLVTDAMKNLQRADFPIYVFKSNYSKRFFISNLDFLWKDCNLTKVSLILNAYDFSNSYGYGSKYGGKKGYGKYSSYGYGYGYGYGYYEAAENENSVKKNKLKSFFKS
ncbi:MAG: polysaccharide biosynthesis tyrosine autokinase [Bacteroidota bacterium]